MVLSDTIKVKHVLLNHAPVKHVLVKHVLPHKFTIHGESMGRYPLDAPVSASSSPAVTHSTVQPRPLSPSPELSPSTDYTLDELCAVACAEAWRGDGEILASPIGIIPSIGARLARATFSPDLLLTDGIASLIQNLTPVGDSGPAHGNFTEKVIEGYMPYRLIFDLVWSGRRHVMMGATQVDRFGNQNIACIGPFGRPKAQLLGMRGAPGNTIHHPTSYWIPNHSPKTFVARVDVVSGVGTDRAAALPNAGGRFHHLRRIISNKAVFDFETPDGAMRLRSLHPGVSLEDVQKNTGFELVIPDTIPETRAPTQAEVTLMRTVIDPSGLGRKEVKA